MSRPFGVFVPALCTSALPAGRTAGSATKASGGLHRAELGQSPASNPSAAASRPGAAAGEERPPYAFAQPAPSVELHCVVKHFIHGQPRQHGEVKGLSLMVMPGEILVLLGPSGCGKTTTLRLIAGFEQPDAGTVRIQGRLVADRTQSLAPEKRNLGMVFQDYALFPHLTVAQNAGFGLYRWPRPDRRRRVAEVLELVGLAELANRYPHELSGGQQQRVALARALAPQPAVILFDEPFSNLDADLRLQMRTEVRRILKESGSTALFVTHDQAEAMALGDRIAVMRRGYIEQIDTPERIFHMPHNRFVAEFLGAADFLPAMVTPDGLASEIGLLPAAHPLRPGLEVDVLVRPHDLVLESDAESDRSLPGWGVVDAAEFGGERWLYRVRLPSGRTVRSLMPHTAVFPLGSPVRVALIADHGLVAFQGEHSVRR
ncbi:MAG: ABC transporter ATP-binding protein [Caldilineales bacterium]|nr:ABC transporter ATP-binding protein [Caldilineales bacterium]